MKIETSTSIPADVLKDIEGKMRKAAVDSKNEKFFGPNDKIEVVNGPGFPSVEEIAKKAKAAPLGDATLCAIAYAFARQYCAGDPVCDAIALAAYQACLSS